MDEKTLAVLLLSLIRDLARSQHAGESAEVADCADKLLTEITAPEAAKAPDPLVAMNL
jgi:hypothetical protein